MRMFYTFGSTLTFIVYSFECSSQSVSGPPGERKRRTPPSPTGEQDPPNLNHRLETPFRDRSRSLSNISPSTIIIGYPLEQLGYLRLIPRTNEGLRFKFRKFVFPEGKAIGFRAKVGYHAPERGSEYIALSGTNCDVFAILEHTGVLRGIYRTTYNHSRVKMNMMSGDSENMTEDEMRDCPVGRKHPIFPQSYRKAFANYDSLQSEPNECGQRDPDSSSSTRRHSPERTSFQEHPLTARSLSPPGRPPPNEVLGCLIEQLGYIRLIPSTNRHQRFEFRKYVFPADKPIRMRRDGLTYAFEGTRQYLVLSTSNGDVYAILDSSQTLRGILTTDRTHSRVKINMLSSRIDILTPDEIRDCPVGGKQPIFLKSFTQVSANKDSLQSVWYPRGDNHPSHSSSNSRNPREQSFSQRAHLRARSTSPPGRPPSDQVFGYTIQLLGYLRLVPQANRDRRFEFRRYVISSDKPFRFQVGHNIYVPLSTREYIVLSTSDGEVFAILEYTEILRGIYGIGKDRARIKINMMNSAYSKMSATEMLECRVGNKYPIFPRWFKEEFSNEDSLEVVYR